MSNPFHDYMRINGMHFVPTPEENPQGTSKKAYLLRLLDLYEQASELRGEIKAFQQAMNKPVDTANADETVNAIRQDINKILDELLPLAL